MARPIKFRAWDGEKMIKSFLHIGEGGRGYLIHGPQPEPKYEVMQFTGLFDRNDTPIYESDIVEFQPIAVEPERYVVEWGHFGFTYKKPGSDDTHYLTNQYLTVLGNVWGHPHLLEDKS